MKISGEIDGVGVLLVPFDEPHYTFRKRNFVQIDKIFNFFLWGEGLRLAWLLVRFDVILSTSSTDFCVEVYTCCKMLSGGFLAHTDCVE